MIRRFAIAAATLSLVACASQGTDDAASASSHLDSADQVPVTVIDNGGSLFRKNHADDELVATVRSAIDLKGFREARLESITGKDGERLVVQLLGKDDHSLEVARIDVDVDLGVQKITRDYARTEEEETLPETHAAYACPDETVEFIAFCPNRNTFELDITNKAADAAEAAGLKTVRLLKNTATHDAWLNYMACPKLVGNFYDGDANPNEIVVYNGSLTAREIAANVKFNLQTTNIWVACQAYKDPMLSAVQTSAKTQKYAAGINNLRVGPSDKAALCAMQAAIAGQPMTSSFNDCYRQLDGSYDHWGFGGGGMDKFATMPEPTETPVTPVAPGTAVPATP